ncbi:hypothetical protein F4X73_08500 [Candidatus Poribacteria bacterium]|nr:hypothetical protein [Candidatus Poribacteria bacterium]
MVRSVSDLFKSFTRKFKDKTRVPKLRGEIDSEMLGFAYEVLIQHKKESIQHYKTAIAMLIAQRETKKNSVQNVTDDINKFKNLLASVKNKKHALTVALQQAGISQEEIEQHSDYIQFQSDYNAIQSDLDEKNARLSKLQQDVKKAEDRIEPFRLQIHQLHQELAKIQQEQKDTIHDHLSKLNEKKIADVLAGIR